MAADITYGSLGELISGRRHSLGITQFELAEQLRVSDQAVSKWERNYSRPSLRVQNELIKLLQINESDYQAAQSATPSHLKVIQSVSTYVTFGLIVASLVLSIVAVILLILDQLVINQAVIMLGIATALLAVIQFDQTDDKLNF